MVSFHIRSLPSKVVRPITIIGGGISGLTLGLLLRQRGVPVQLWEAHDYPRHRVCGEFISGRGGQLLKALLPNLINKGVAARSVRFFADGRSSEMFGLPAAGLSISRWDLDNALADAFISAEGELMTKSRWSESYEKPGVVRATGRRIDANGRGWTGLKAHLTRFKTTADLEMHFTDYGYIGISKLPDGTNLCALVRSGFGTADFRKDPGAVFRRLLHPESADRLALSEIDPTSCCGVSGISFQKYKPTNECCLGDAIQMISPFTGNGMSLAVESAFFAAGSLVEYAEGALDWPNAVQQVNARCAKAFRTRFAAASVLRQMTDRSWTREAMLSSLRTVPRLFSLFFGLTR
jgi:2-polyprenyl-6-methoxyphenol hydroxylase-like FAD-dependent oxidoreductase